MTKNAVVLLSGGLDSILAAKLVKDMGINVHGLFIKTMFFNTKKTNKFVNVMNISKKINIPLSVIDCDKEYIKMLRKPKHGYGKNINPCIDCHIFFLKKAKQFLPVVNADFIITGEVVGQRPMSQHLETIYLIEEEAECRDIVLRPLSGKLLRKTKMEEEGIIDKKNLLDISGRSRSRQIELIKELRLRIKPHTGGGCLLTHKNFKEKMEDYFIHYKNDDFIHLSLMPVGRHFRLSDSVKIIVGKDEKENDIIYAARKNGSVLFPIEEIPGPTALIIGEPNQDELNQAAKIVSRYSDGDGEKEIVYKTKDNEVVINAEQLDDEEISKMRIN